jgi:hypothetical protein
LAWWRLGAAGQGRFTPRCACEAKDRTCCARAFGWRGDSGAQVLDNAVISAGIMDEARDMLPRLSQLMQAALRPGAAATPADVAGAAPSDAAGASSTSP